MYRHRYIFLTVLEYVRKIINHEILAEYQERNVEFRNKSSVKVIY